MENYKLEHETMPDGTDKTIKKNYQKPLLTKRIQFSSPIKKRTLSEIDKLIQALNFPKN